MLPFLSLLPHSSLLSYHLLPPFFPPRKHTFHRYHFFSFFEVFDSLFLSSTIVFRLSRPLSHVRKLSFNLSFSFLSRFFLAPFAQRFYQYFSPVSILHNSLIFRLESNLNIFFPSFFHFFFTRIHLSQFLKKFPLLRFFVLSLFSPEFFKWPIAFPPFSLSRRPSLQLPIGIIFPLLLAKHAQSLLFRDTKVSILIPLKLAILSIYFVPAIIFFLSQSLSFLVPLSPSWFEVIQLSFFYQWSIPLFLFVSKNIRESPSSVPYTSVFFHLHFLHLCLFR